MFVKNGWKPHSSHRMGEWRDTMVAAHEGATPRFGKLRGCADCDAEECLGGGAGFHAAHEELAVVCPFAEPAVVRNSTEET